MLSGHHPSHSCLPSPKVTPVGHASSVQAAEWGWNVGQDRAAWAWALGWQLWKEECGAEEKWGVSGRARLGGGRGFAVGWGWGKEEGIGRAREVFHRKESSWEKKMTHLVSYWLLGVLFRKQRIRKRTQHKASRVLLNIRHFSLWFFWSLKELITPWCFNRAWHTGVLSDY